MPVDFAHNLNYISGSPGWSGIIPGTLVALTGSYPLAIGVTSAIYIVGLPFIVLAPETANRPLPA